MFLLHIEVSVQMRLMGGRNQSPLSWAVSRVGIQSLNVYFSFAEGFLSSEDMVVVLGEAVGFVADLLEEAEAWVVSSEFEGFGLALDVDEFFFF